MAAELEKLGKEIGRNGHRVIGGLLGVESKVIGWLGAPKSLSENGKKPEKTTLEVEWQRQANRFIELGFHTELNLTKDDYLNSLPKFESQPREFKGRLDIPVIVETRISLRRMLDLIGIAQYFGADLVKDWEKGQFETPKMPYSTWLNDGSINLKKSVGEVRKALKSDERGGTIFDGIALYLKDPKILEHHFLDLPGSQVDSDYAPYLYRWNGQSGLHPYFVDDRDPHDGSVVAGKL